MTRNRAAGLVLAVAVLLCASTTGVASAALPEFSAPGGFPVKFKGTSGAAALEKVDVHCSSSTSEGELVSTKSAKKVIVRFKGCKLMFLSLGFPCHSLGAKAEEVVTPNLQGKAVYIKEAAPKEAGVVYQAEGGGWLARFECVIMEGVEKETETVVVDGLVIAKVPAKNAKGEEQYDRELTSLEEVFAQKEGAQVPGEYVEEGFKVKATPSCELKAGEGGATGSCGLEYANKLETAAKVEFKV